MKRIIFTISMLTCISIVSFAQAPQQAGSAMPASANANDMKAQQQANRAKQAQAMGERQAKDLQRRFELNDEQYKKAVEAETEFFSKLLETRSPDKPHDPSKVTAFNEERDAKLKTAMTPEQFAKYYPTRPGARAAMSPSDPAPSK